jgi:hypothetical protein
MNAKIDLYKEIGGSFVISSPQPSEVGYFLLVAGNPNNPAVGLTIDGPSFTFQGNVCILLVLLLLLLHQFRVFLKL